MKHPAQRVSSEVLQKLWRDRNCAARLGDLRLECVYEAPPAAISNQPPGTLSQVFKCYDGAEVVMVVHRYLLPDGRIGASGQFDPKMLLIDGIVYYK
jgi:hypothetical protein